MSFLDDLYNRIAENETARNFALTVGAGLAPTGPLQTAALQAYAANLNSALANDLSNAQISPELKFQLQAAGAMIPGTIGTASTAALAGTMRDMANAPRFNYPEGYQSPSIPNIESIPYTEPAPVDTFKITPEQQAARQAALEEVRAGMYSPYGLGTQNFTEGRAVVGNAPVISPAASAYLSDIAASSGERLGPPIPAGFQPPVEVPAFAQTAPVAQAAPQYVGPTVPAAPDWRNTGQPVQQLAPETIAAMTPQEQAAAELGYEPPKALAAPPVLASVLSTAAPAEQPAAASRQRIEAPAGNAQFDELLKQVPKQYQGMAKTIKAINSERAVQRQQAIRDAAQQVESSRQAEHASIDAGEKELIDTGMNRYGAARYAVQRDRALADMNAELAAAELKVQGMESGAAAEKLKDLRSEIKAKYDVKRFDETPEYKAAMAEKAKISDKVLMQTKFANAIDSMQQMMASGKIDDARRYGASEVAQIMNSLVNSNAIQLSEMLIRYPGLLTPSEKSQLAGKGIFDFSNSLRQIMSPSEAMLAAEELRKDQGFVERLIHRGVSADPISFIKSAVTSANNNAKSLNQQIDEFIRKPTSPKIANLNDIPLIPETTFNVAPQPAAQGAVVHPTAVQSALEKYKRK